jgi:hypothetical protein
MKRAGGFSSKRAVSYDRCTARVTLQGHCTQTVLLLLLPHSACPLLLENAELAAAAIAASEGTSGDAASPPLVQAGDVSAIDFVCALWLHLNHQLQVLAAERDVRDAARASAASKSSEITGSADRESKLNPDFSMSLEEQVADPFAAFAAARAQSGSSSGVAAAPQTAIEAELAEVAAAADEAEEEKVRMGGAGAFRFQWPQPCPAAHVDVCVLVLLCSSVSGLSHTCLHVLHAPRFLCRLQSLHPSSPARLVAPHIPRSAHSSGARVLATEL